MSKTIEEIEKDYIIELGYKKHEDYPLMLTKLHTIDASLTLHKFMTKVAERYARSQTQELIDWKESASKVFKNLDLQTLGKTLGIGLGEDVSTNVLPKVKELIEQNAELVEALESVVKLQDKYFGERDIHRVLQKRVFEIEDLLTKYNHLNKKT